MQRNLYRTAISDYPEVNHAYTRFRSYGIVRWVVDLAILGFAVPILARNPGHDLLIASAYSVGVAGLCVLLFVPMTGPRSPSDPRPASWVAPALALTQVALIPAAALSINSYANGSGRYSRRDNNSNNSLGKRIYISHGRFGGSLDQRLALAGGCCCIASVIAGMVQLFYVWKIHGQATGKKRGWRAGTVETLE